MRDNEALMRDNEALMRQAIIKKGRALKNRYSKISILNH